MGISLKNHEDRITALESSVINYKDMLSGFVYLPPTQSADIFESVDVCDFDASYDFMVIEACTSSETINGTKVRSYQNVIWIKGLSYDPQTKSSTNAVRIYYNYTGSGRDELLQIGIYNNRVTAYHINRYADTNTITKVVLLKLYYSFSYNIIYRATHLLEKIMSQTKEVLAL